MRPPDDKVDAIEKELVRLFLHGDYVRKDGTRIVTDKIPFFLKKDLESIIGKLTHGNLVFPRSRPFINSLLSLNRRLNTPYMKGKTNSDLERSARLFVSVLRDWRSFDSLLQTHRGPIEGDWACGDASGNGGFGYFSPRGIRCHDWGSRMAAGFRDLSRKDEKVSSTLQEGACMTAAFLEWAPSAPCNSLFTYVSDADNLTHNWKKGRSAAERVNALQMLVAAESLKRNLHLRVVWHSREAPYAKLADMLSRGNVQGFVASSPIPNLRRGLIPSSVTAAVQGSLRTPTSSSDPTSRKARSTSTTASPERTPNGSSRWAGSRMGY